MDDLLVEGDALAELLGGALRNTSLFPAEAARVVILRIARYIGAGASIILKEAFPFLNEVKKNLLNVGRCARRRAVSQPVVPNGNVASLLKPTAA